MERWNQEVIDTVPAERLLVWHPKDGWEPLCEFLELDVPGEPVPNVNDTENFQKNLIMGPPSRRSTSGGSTRSRLFRRSRRRYISSAGE